MGRHLWSAVESQRRLGGEGVAQKRQHEWVSEVSRSSRQENFRPGDRYHHITLLLSCMRQIPAKNSLRPLR